MTHDCYSTKRTTVWPQDRNGDPGYAIKYQDGYISWCPKETFDRDYRAVDGGHLTFGQAVEALKIGKKVRRLGWNGNGMWLTLASENWSASFYHHGAHKPADFQGYSPFITMFTADKRYVPWLASQTDMLAQDWEELPQE